MTSGGQRLLRGTAEVDCKSCDVGAHATATLPGHLGKPLGRELLVADNTNPDSTDDSENSSEDVDSDDLDDGDAKPAVANFKKGGEQQSDTSTFAKKLTDAKDDADAKVDADAAKKPASAQSVFSADELFIQLGSDGINADAPSVANALPLVKALLLAATWQPSTATRYQALRWRSACYPSRPRPALPHQQGARRGVQLLQLETRP
ncbi:hypothetical protein WJX73_002879 [Symbiochloris irregularis]|uniref:Uncharacterized protein n=1 Tax=Symbiochloris irregularis TaxID=706552 RepID=A0AAW1NRQ9_9CHLO